MTGLLLLLAANGWAPPAELLAEPQQPAVAVADVYRFLARQVVNDAREFYYRRGWWLTRQREFWPGNEFDEWFDAASEDNATRLAAWQSLWECQLAIVIPPLEADKGRARLAELRAIIGPDAYRLGLMPGPIDWRFTARADP